MTKPKLIVILGPTACGKSKLGIELAKKFNGYILSADSRQVYRGMDIGTDKVTGKRVEVTGIPAVIAGDVHHFLLDIKDPSESWTLADFQSEVYRITRKFRSASGFKTKIPFLIGGTGMYISSIVENWVLPKSAPNMELREKLERMPLPDLVKQLKKRDPASHAIVDLKNKRRVVRALEFVLTKKTSFAAARTRRKPRFDVLQIGIQLPFTKIEKRISERVDDMMKRGLMEESWRLVQTHPWELPAMSSLGYRHIGMYLQGVCSLEEAILRLKRDTRKYAKRQMTWFKRDETIQWVTSKSEAQQKVKKFCASISSTSP